jgi:low affinity Fe/Cu permease
MPSWPPDGSLLEAAWNQIVQSLVVAGRIASARRRSLMKEKRRVSPAQWTTTVGSLTSHPGAFLIVILYGVFWFLFERSTFDWHAIATLIVWTMTLFIQRADRRDTLAIHAKLDELLKATREARTELASIDEREPEAIEKIRDRERQEAETR